MVSLVPGYKQTSNIFKMVLKNNLGPREFCDFLTEFVDNDGPGLQITMLAYGS